MTDKERELKILLGRVSSHSASAAYWRAETARFQAREAEEAEMWATAAIHWDVFETERINERKHREDANRLARETA